MLVKKAWQNLNLYAFSETGQDVCVLIWRGESRSQVDPFFTPTNWRWQAPVRNGLRNSKSHRIDQLGLNSKIHHAAGNGSWCALHVLLEFENPFLYVPQLPRQATQGFTQDKSLADLGRWGTWPKRVPWRQEGTSTEVLRGWRKMQRSYSASAVVVPQPMRDTAWLFLRASFAGFAACPAKLPNSDRSGVK